MSLRVAGTKLGECDSVLNSNLEQIRTCDLELGSDSDKEWSGVEGKLLADLGVEVFEIDATAFDSTDGRHSSTPVGIGDLKDRTLVEHKLHSND